MSRLIVMLALGVSMGCYETHPVDRERINHTMTPAGYMQTNRVTGETCRYTSSGARLWCSESQALEWALQEAERDKAETAAMAKRAREYYARRAREEQSALEAEQVKAREETALRNALAAAEWLTSEEANRKFTEKRKRQRELTEEQRREYDEEWQRKYDEALKHLP